MEGKRRMQWSDLLNKKGEPFVVSKGRCHLPSVVGVLDLEFDCCCGASDANVVSASELIINISNMIMIILLESLPLILILPPDNVLTK
jgi:hypothetical protein